jgi:hypothetical protein
MVGLLIEIEMSLSTETTFGVSILKLLPQQQLIAWAII